MEASSSRTPRVLDPDDDRVFLSAEAPLRPGNAVVGLIQPGSGRYLMQYRDPIESIFFPAHWGLFGGEVEEGEGERECLARELGEELALDIADADVTYFTRFDIDFGFSGHPTLFRSVYSVAIRPDVVSRLELREGRSMQIFGANEILTEPRVAPYDRLAIWMHSSVARLAATAPSDERP